MHLGQCAILYGPEIVHHHRGRHEEQYQQPRAPFGFITEGDAESSQERDHSGERNCNRSQWDSLCCSMFNRLLRKIADAANHED